jgi:ribosomal protein L40E
VQRRKMNSNVPLTKGRLITQAVAMPIVLAVVGYIVITGIDSVVASELELGFDVSMFRLFEVFLISLLTTAYVAGLFQQVLKYRSQQQMGPVSISTSTLVTSIETRTDISETADSLSSSGKFCIHCGAQNRDEAVFCKKCGKNIQ